MLDDALADGEAALPLSDASGHTVAWFKWQPDRPGATLLAETTPAMAGLLVAVGFVIFLLIQRLHRSSAELEAARAEAIRCKRDLSIHREALRFPRDPDFDARYPIPPRRSR